MQPGQAAQVEKGLFVDVKEEVCAVRFRRHVARAGMGREGTRNVANLGGGGDGRSTFHVLDIGGSTVL